MNTKETLSTIGAGIITGLVASRITRFVERKKEEKRIDRSQEKLIHQFAKDFSKFEEKTSNGEVNKEEES